MKKEDLIYDILRNFARFNQAKTFFSFQIYLKGENFLLSYLSDNGGKGTPGKLAEALNVSPARIAAILRSLEIKKLVKRGSDGEDKRRVVVEITEKGTEWVKAARDEITRQAFELFDRLGEQDVMELSRILKKMMKTEEVKNEGKSESNQLPENLNDNN